MSPLMYKTEEHHMERSQDANGVPPGVLQLTTLQRSSSSDYQSTGWKKLRDFTPGKHDSISQPKLGFDDTKGTGQAMYDASQIRSKVCVVQ